MIKRITEYLEYRRNKRITQREALKMFAAILPSIRGFTEKQAEILNFIQQLAASAKNMEDEKLVSLVLEQVANILSTNQSRLVEIFTYLASLSPDDIQKILVDAMVETMPTAEDTE